MPIALVVEDGTGLVDSNTYTSVANVRLYASNRGIVLSIDDEVVASQLINATDLLETYACRYQGARTNEDQALEWPRTDVYLYGILFPDNAIPSQLIAAQSQLVIAQFNGFVLQPNVSAQDYVIREKVGPIETEYANPTNVGLMPVFTAAEALLAPLFGECASNKFAIRTIRV